jgi:hypothetical protein
MRTSDNTGQVSSNRACFVSAETFDLDFEILRHQFREDDAFIKQPARHHSLAQVRRQRAGASDDAFGVIAWHLRMGRAWCRGPHALFDVDKAEIVLGFLSLANADEPRVSETPKRAATFHPISSIQHFNLVTAATAFERCDEFSNVIAFE